MDETDKTFLQIIVVTIISFFAVIFLLGLSLLLFGMKVTEDWEPYEYIEPTDEEINKLFEEMKAIDADIKVVETAANELLDIMDEMEEDGFIEDLEEGIELLNELQELLEEW